MRETSRYKDDIFIATSNNDYYEAYVNTKGTGGYQYVVEYRNVDFQAREDPVDWNAQVSQLFGVGSTNQVSLDVSTRLSVGNTIPSNQPWWGVNGWTSQLTTAWGAVGNFFVANIPVNNMVITIGAFRPLSEPCSFCLNTDDNVAVVKTLSDNIKPEWVVIDSSKDVRDATKAEWKLMTENLSYHPNTTVFGFGFGTNNDDYVYITDCKFALNDVVCGNPAYSDVRFYVWVKSFSVFGDQFVHYFEVTCDGSIGRSLGQSSDEYHPTQRLWFSATGWTATYTNFGTDTIIRSYVEAFEGGFVLGDWNSLLGYCGRSC